MEKVKIFDLFGYKFNLKINEKDKLINMYQTIAYEKIKSINELSTLFLNLGFFGLVTYGLFTQKYFRYYFMGSIGLGYLLTLIKITYLWSLHFLKAFFIILIL